MAAHGAIQTITRSTKSVRYVLNDESKTAYMVTAKAITQSTTTAWYRLTRTPIAWSVTPEEYRSRLLMAKSCTMAKRRNTTTNQAGMALWWANGRKALLAVPTVVRKVPTAAPRAMIRISGTAVPRNTQPTMAGLEASGGQ